MKDKNSILLSFKESIFSYLNSSETIIYIITDFNLNILDHSENLSELLKFRTKLINTHIDKILLPESRGILPLDDNTKQLTIGLNLQSFAHNSFHFDCKIFKSDMGYLIIGGHLMLTDDFFLRKMTELNSELTNIMRDLNRKNKELNAANNEINSLRGIIPICMHCKEIRDDKGYWNQLEKYITEHSEAQFSHSICPDCMEKYYPELDDDE